MHLKKGQHFIRKRDRVLVSVYSISRKRRTVTYCTYPMLVIWTTTIDSFRKNFREVEEKNHVQGRTTAAGATGGRNAPTVLHGNSR